MAVRQSLVYGQFEARQLGQIGGDKGGVVLPALQDELAPFGRLHEAVR
jgi:hypothetical protein